MNLIDFGYEIEYTKTVRYVKTERELRKRARYYLTLFKKRIYDSELRLLIDSLLFNRYLPARQCKDMIAKIEGLSNEFLNHVLNIFRICRTICHAIISYFYIGHIG